MLGRKMQMAVSQGGVSLTTLSKIASWETNFTVSPDGLSFEKKFNTGGGWQGGLFDSQPESGLYAVEVIHNQNVAGDEYYLAGFYTPAFAGKDYNSFSKIGYSIVDGQVRTGWWLLGNTQGTTHVLVLDYNNKRVYGMAPDGLSLIPSAAQTVHSPLSELVFGVEVYDNRNAHASPYTWTVNTGQAPLHPTNEALVVALEGTLGQPIIRGLGI